MKKDMELSEIQAYFETNKNDKNVQNYLTGLSKPTLEGVEEFIKGDDGKKWIGKQNDVFFTKSLDTWKNNNLETEIDKEVKKRFPEKDQKDVEIEKLKAKFDQIEKEKVRESMLNKALKIADDKKLPKDILDFFVDTDEQKTIKNLEALENTFTKHVENMVNERLKGSSYVPPKDSNNNTITLETIKKMSPDEINKNWDKVREVLKSSK